MVPQDGGPSVALGDLIEVVAVGQQVAFAVGPDVDMLAKQLDVAKEVPTCSRRPSSWLPGTKTTFVP
jgi:hypothetical protein